MSKLMSFKISGLTSNLGYNNPLSMPLPPCPLFCSRACRRRAFTLIELLAVLAVIGILAALLIPAAGRVKGKANATKCQSNLRQLMMATTLYQNDHKGNTFESYDNLDKISWFEELSGRGSRENYLGTKEIGCPLHEPAAGSDFPGYGMTSLVLWHPTLGRTDDRPLFFKYRLKEPSAWPVYMCADFIGIYNLDNPKEDAPAQRRFAARHDGLANVVMADGHVESVPYGDGRWHQTILNNGSYYDP